MAEFGPVAGLVDINRDMALPECPIRKGRGVLEEDMKVLLYILTCKALYLT